MLPILISIGPLTIFSFSIFLIISWLVFSFLFWRQCRDFGISEEKSFDMMFYGTLVAILAARLVYVVCNWSTFQGQLLKTAAVWVAPGFSFYGGMIGAFLMLVLIIKANKIKFTQLLDVMALSVIPALMLGAVGTFLDGTYVGKTAKTFWSVNYIGHQGLRHPIQLYTIICLILIMILTYYIYGHVRKQKLAYGLTGMWFVLLFSLSQFIIEFFRDDSVYFYHLTRQQWVLVAFLCESIGGLIVLTSLRQKMVRVYYKLKNKFKKREFKNE